MTSTFQDGVPDVISRRKVLPPGEWAQNFSRRLYAAAYASSWSIVHHHHHHHQFISSTTVQDSWRHNEN